jgi:hypothetical protein
VHIDQWGNFAVESSGTRMWRGFAVQLLHGTSIELDNGVQSQEDTEEIIAVVIPAIMREEMV